MAKSNELRQRKKTTKAKDDNKKDTGSKDDALPAPEHNFEESETPEPTLSSVFFNHPLVRVSQFILLPYLLFQGFNYVALQRPEWVGHATGGVLQFRPAVDTYGERQVLIIGASVSDNKKVASTLSSTLQLEIAHETFDSLHNYCRDGTVSWYQFMRFLNYAPGPLNKNVTDVGIKKVGAWKELCVDRNSSLVSQFFHPREYAPSQVCSSREMWSNCWSKECILTLQSSWDCQSGHFDGEFTEQSERHCQPPFRKVLHQTRHPLTTIETLNQTYCDIDSIKGSFLTLVAGFFPHRDWQDMPSCLEAVSWYTLDFESTLLRARRDDGAVDGMFQMETASPCEVASLAGFTDPTHAMYGAHLDRLTKVCHDEKDQLDKKTLKKAEAARSKHAFVPRIPRSLQKKTVTWDELEYELSVSNKDLPKDFMKSLKRLTKDLGYAEDSTVIDEEEFA